MAYVKPDALIGNHEKKLIHVVKAKLGLDDNAYRAVLWGVAKVTSSKELRYLDYWALKDRLRELGDVQGVKVFFSAPSKSKASPSPSSPSLGTGEGGRGAGGSSKMRPFTEPARSGRAAGFNEMASKPQQQMIYGLWEDVARNKSPEALKVFLKKRFKVNAMTWLTSAKAEKVIEALKSMQARTIAKGE